ncbi:MAG: M43 family zinc metalloprotease [Brumimicrobium sp.]
MKFRILLVAVFGMFGGFALAQHENPCAADDVRNELWKQFPELEQANAEYENLLQSMNSFQRGDDDDDILPDSVEVVIPVVFHVIHEYGDENISDQRIYDAMEVLNNDFRLLNTDASQIIPEFQSIAADVKINFKLATLDPFGNPTNGINRYHSVETNIGDQFSKLNQWPRSRYLNVWVYKTFEGKPSTLGYSHYPIDVEGGRRYMDGVAVRSSTVGSFSRTLTHEVGHYLNLIHVWGGSNEPGVVCGDDGVDDTPLTKGWWTCADLYSRSCGDVDHIENKQNYMDYSNCPKMFTKGQATRMRNALKLEVSQRSNLWQESNLLASVPDGQEYDPVADFYVDDQANRNRLAVVMGSPIKFKNWSYRLQGTDITYTWTFQDADITTSNDVDPTVTFTSPGWKTVSLTVENNGRTNTVTKENFIWIAQDWPAFSGNVLFDFDDNPNYWVIQNPSNQPYQWQVTNGAGVHGSSAMFLNVSNPYTNPYQFSNEWFFEVRRGKVESAFVSQPIDLSYYTTNPIISFDYAVATEGLTVDEITESLEVYISRNGGVSWQRKLELSSIDLINNGSGWTNFIPGPTSVWTNVEIELAEVDKVPGALLKFVYIGSDKSNNIAIDNIRIDGSLSTISQEQNNLNIFPNPTSGDKGWNISYDASTWGGGTAELTDVSGRIINTINIPENQSEVNIKPGSNASNGIYFIKIVNKENIVQSKLILK